MAVSLSPLTHTGFFYYDGRAFNRALLVCTEQSVFLSQPDSNMVYIFAWAFVIKCALFA